LLKNSKDYGIKHIKFMDQRIDIRKENTALGASREPLYSRFDRLATTKTGEVILTLATVGALGGMGAVVYHFLLKN